MTSVKKTGIILLSLGLLFVFAGTTACQKKAAEPAAVQAQKPASEFEGTVKTGLGKYLYLDKAQGFDIITQGFDAATLVGKDIRVKGELIPDKPSIFRADTIEVKNASGATSNVYTRTQDLTVEDFIDVKARTSYPALTITGGELGGVLNMYNTWIPNTLTQLESQQAEFSRMGQAFMLGRYAIHWHMHGQLQYKQYYIIMIWMLGKIS